MTCRRGITLIETLAATVLLALLAATCVPMLRHLTTIAERRDAPADVDLAALSALADLLLDDPGRFGIDEDGSWSDRSIPWPDGLRETFALPLECADAELTVQSAVEPEIDREWLLITCHELVVARCRYLPKRETEGSSDP